MKIELDNGINLVPLHLGHTKHLFEILTANCSHFSPWLPFVNELHSIEQTEKFIREAQVLWESKKDFSFAILESNRARGLISAKELNWIEKCSELGYWLDPALQNQGVMSHAINHLVEFLTRELGFQTFWIKCAEGNLPSQRVANKAKFELVGIEKRRDEEKEEVFLTYLRKEKTGEGLIPAYP
ncbi:GNAT family N-acetyltransferase [Aquiflexum gelatinilyticum]|uniref:GNAT family N-acetyltransferase n=1 Tax=Aquiflexum gelatinilyticum TaxID=2961943 RepID=A0A9X2P4B6_9BACT|nr:GNAT family N-acetyltransferase [Aquiflexum gelatinilyticum]MCR9015713.1 GNAT family N-acetyltransferase [Aquiflexum gelatinilyticum]MCS4436175.1 GNAT family N-acetyltransferase [Aquiflexum gelatinilyticum]